MTQEEATHGIRAISEILTDTKIRDLIIRQMDLDRMDTPTDSCNLHNQAGVDLWLSVLTAKVAHFLCVIVAVERVRISSTFSVLRPIGFTST